MNEEDKNPEDKTRFDLSVRIRNLEIDLFWKRSLFFGGFISLAFAGYVALRQSDVRIIPACFGMVCSLVWTLANRGSKYWQESWERKVERYEPSVTGPLFSVEEEPQKKGCWGGQKYSVSKLAIALSDYVFALCLALVAGETVRRYIPENAQAV